MTKEEAEILMPLIQKLKKLNVEASKIKGLDALDKKLNVIRGFLMALEIVEETIQEKAHQPLNIRG